MVFKTSHISGALEAHWLVATAQHRLRGGEVIFCHLSFQILQRLLQTFLLQYLQKNFRNLSVPLPFALDHCFSLSLGNFYHFTFSFGSSKMQEFQKNIYFCFIVYTEDFDCVDHNRLWQILKEMGIPDHITFLLRNLYAGQEATVRTGHGPTGWFQIGKGVRQGYILSS